MHIYSFEKLEAWKNARVAVSEIYKLTANFPEEEKFGITNQLRRASTSISANLAEGTSRKSKKDMLRFINISYGSSVEVINFLILCFDLEFISEKQYTEIREKVEKITFQINALYNSLNK